MTKVDCWLLSDCYVEVTLVVLSLWNIARFNRVVRIACLNVCGAFSVLSNTVTFSVSQRLMLEMRCSS